MPDLFNIVEDEIELIEQAGEQQVFDFQVQHPDHLYIAEDIVVSNCQAHASAYACDALWCAWLLTYYPVEWLCALINQDAEESLPEIVKMYKPLMLPISAKKSQTQTITERQSDGSYKIRLGFNLIKGLGQKSLLKFMQKRSSMIDPQDFLFGVTPSIIQKLVDSGALDEVEPNRKRFAMAIALLKQKKQNKITKKNFGQLWTRLKKVEPFTIEQLYDIQMKTFGMSIFVNIWGQYGSIIKKFIMDGKAVLDFSNFKKFDLKLAYVPVNIFDVKTRKQKNGKQMAFVKFVTPSGQINESPIFAETWQFLKKKIKADFTVYFALFTYKQDKDGFILGDGVYGCNQLKASTFLLNLKYIARGEEQPDA